MREPPPLPDRIALEGMVFYGHHGVNPQERELGQRFLVDLYVEADLQTPGQSDALDDTVNYTQLYHAVKAVMEGEPCHLLERVAEVIAQRVLEAFPVTAVGVRVTKPSPPIAGAVLKGASVEIYRRRGQERGRRL